MRNETVKRADPFAANKHFSLWINWKYKQTLSMLLNEPWVHIRATSFWFIGDQQHIWLGWSCLLYDVSHRTVCSFMAPHISLSSLSRVREQMQSQDSFILRWEMEIWRAARLMYLTQWKLQAEHMKTSFREASSHPDLLPPCWMEFSTRFTAETLKTPALILPPLSKARMPRLSKVWWLSTETWLPRVQLWAKISSTDLCLFKLGQWLSEPKGGGGHRKVLTLMFSDLFRSFSYKGKQNPAMNAPHIVTDDIFSKIEMSLNIENVKGPVGWK